MSGMQIKNITNFPASTPEVKSPNLEGDGVSLLGANGPNFDISALKRELNRPSTVGAAEVSRTEGSSVSRSAAEPSTTAAQGTGVTGSETSWQRMLLEKGLAIGRGILNYGASFQDGYGTRPPRFSVPAPSPLTPELRTDVDGLLGSAGMRSRGPENSGLRLSSPEQRAEFERIMSELDKKV